MMKKPRYGFVLRACFIALFLSPLFLHGAQTEEELLEELIRLAPWDLREARFVRLHYTRAHRNQPVDWPARPLQRGNAWVIEEDLEGESRLIINGCERVNLLEKNQLREKEDPDEWTRPRYRGIGAGEWIEVDLPAEIANVLRILGDESDGEASFRWRHKGTYRGRLLWFAVNIAKSGHPQSDFTSIDPELLAAWGCRTRCRQGAGGNVPHAAETASGLAFPFVSAG